MLAPSAPLETQSIDNEQATHASANNDLKGTFRANCEAVVGVLRKNKDILLMLLEVFMMMQQWEVMPTWLWICPHGQVAAPTPKKKRNQIDFLLLLSLLIYLM